MAAYLDLRLLGKLKKRVETALSSLEKCCVCPFPVYGNEYHLQNTMNDYPLPRGEG